MAVEVDSAEQFRLDDALALLDANFPFRSQAGADGTRSYRLTPNGPEIQVRGSADGVVVHLPIEVPALRSRLAESRERPGSHGYHLASRSQLQQVMQVLLSEAVVSLPKAGTTAPSQATTMSEQSDPPTQPQATNTVLYGPPGTGKTYLTATRAVELCDGPGGVGVERAQIMQRYEELRREGRISFVTFHQSYGYEEFVEGLRPQASESGQVSYSVVPGVFRRACLSASLQKLVEPGLSEKPIRQRTVFKMSLGQNQNEEGRRVFRYCVENGCVLLGWGHDVDFSDCEDEASIYSRAHAEPLPKSAESHARYVHVFKHELQLGDLIVVSSGNNLFRGIAEVTGEYEFVEDGPFHQARAVKWLAVFESGRPVSEIYERTFTASALYKLSPSALRYDRIEPLLSRSERSEHAKPHVLIIDEINRANVSKVFGELITLLEPDKREAQVNALTVKLPYSGEDFCVPSNLHVLATMNTADRSIALLDTALRRRFDFEEVLPDPTTLRGRVVEGVDLERLLTALNQRVEALYDRDHTLGHAYFIDVQTLDDLERVFRRRMLPLLQEYFYENYSNVRRALNDIGEGDFIRRTARVPIPADGEDAYGEEQVISYRVNELPFPVAAYQRIYEAA